MNELGLSNELHRLKRELESLTELEQELRTSLADARRQIVYYRTLIANMKKSSNPSSLQNVLRFF
ncbi:MAG: hypothetical protein QXP70_02940 [Methanomassiliicoccales archaeon]